MLLISISQCLQYSLIHQVCFPFVVCVCESGFDDICQNKYSSLWTRNSIMRGTAFLWCYEGQPKTVAYKQKTIISICDWRYSKTTSRSIVWGFEVSKTSRRQLYCMGVVSLSDQSRCWDPALALERFQFAARGAAWWETQTFPSGQIHHQDSVSCPCQRWEPSLSAPCGRVLMDPGSVQGEMFPGRPTDHWDRLRNTKHQ